MADAAVGQPVRGNKRGDAGGGYNSTIKLVAALGTVPPEGQVTINELTTVVEAVVFGNSITHPEPQQFALYRQLVDPVTGELGPIVEGNAESAAIVNTLADIASSCTTSAGPNFVECSSLFQAATAPHFTPPDNTLAAIEGIVAPYGRGNAAPFSLLPKRRAYAPVLTHPPSGWLFSMNFAQLGLRHPAEILSDKSNNTLWILNQGNQTLTELSTKPEDLRQPVLGTRKVPISVRNHPIDFLFDQPFAAYPPTARPPTPGWFSKRSVWLADDALIFLNADGEACGEPLRNLGLHRPGGLANCDISGDSVCVANIGADEIVMVHKPDAKCNGAELAGRLPEPEKSPGGFLLHHPAHIVKCIVDNSDDWISNSASNSVAALHSFRCTVPASAPITGGGLAAPEGLTCDNQGNVWIANHAPNANSVTEIKSSFFGIPNPPLPAQCLNAAGMDEGYQIKLEALSPPSGFSGVGLNQPYGLAVDSLGNVWVTNEGNDSVTVFVAAGR